ncbi:MAG: hypothetical protein JNJ54_03295 [Myxococcaceae bacterium]|nr:hypothetical protein [Myxococcaceae bacterium]
MTPSWTRCLPLLATACVTVVPPPRPAPVPSPPPRPPPIVVPAGCEGDLSGRYLHAHDPRFRYLALDSSDGGPLLIEVTLEQPLDAGRAPRRFSRDGGLPWLVDAGVVSSPPQAAPALVAVLDLTRTAVGFGGTARPPDGGCAFPVRVSACRPEALILVTPAQLGADCALTDAGWGEQVLYPIPSRDGGFDTARQMADPDAGAEDGGRVTVPPSR